MDRLDSTEQNPKTNSQNGNLQRHNGHAMFPPTQPPAVTHSSRQYGTGSKFSHSLATDTCLALVTLVTQDDRRKQLASPANHRRVRTPIVIARQCCAIIDGIIIVFVKHLVFRHFICILTISSRR